MLSILQARAKELNLQVYLRYLNVMLKQRFREYYDSFASQY